MFGILILIFDHGASGIGKIRGGRLGTVNDGKTGIKLSLGKYGLPLVSAVLFK